MKTHFLLVITTLLSTLPASAQVETRSLSAFTSDISAVNAGIGADTLAFTSGLLSSLTCGAFPVGDLSISDFEQLGDRKFAVREAAHAKILRELLPGFDTALAGVLLMPDIRGILSCLSLYFDDLEIKRRLTRILTTLESHVLRKLLISEEESAGWNTLLLPGCGEDSIGCAALIVEKYSALGCRLTGVSCYYWAEHAYNYCSVTTENCSPCAEYSSRLDTPANWDCSCEQDFYEPFSYLDRYSVPNFDRNICRLAE